METQFSELELRRAEVYFMREERFKMEQLYAIRDAKLRKPLQHSVDPAPELTYKQIDKRCRKRYNEKIKTFAQQFRRRYRNMLHDQIVEYIQQYQIVKRRIENLPDCDEKTRLQGEFRYKETLIGGLLVQESYLVP